MLISVLVRRAVQWHITVVWVESAPDPPAWAPARLHRVGEGVLNLIIWNRVTDYTLLHVWFYTLA
jgi:hypothetical protein